MLRKFRAEIQLLRAVAVATVVVYHVNPAWLPGGFVGVDVFFVISGYLITGHMLGEAARTGRISLLGFWANRARRILPAATIAIIVTAAASCFFLPASQLTPTAWQGVASALYFQNFALAAKSVDYLTQGAADTPFQHFWSLSVEEQFYVVWPLLVLAACWAVVALQRRHPTDELHRMRRTRAIVLVVFSAVVVASLVYSQVSVAHGDPAAYFVTPSRVWELGMGGVLACVLGDPCRLPALRNLLALAGLAAIGAACALYGATTPFPGATALAPVLGCAAVIAAGRTRGLGSLTPLVDLRPVQLLGNWSYSLYLWHFPVVTFYVAVRGEHPGLATGLALIVVSLGLAATSYYFVEQPLRLNGFLRQRRWLTIEAAVTAMAVAAGVAVVPQAVFAHAVSEERERTADLRAGRASGMGAAALSDTRFSLYAPNSDGRIVPIPAEAVHDEPHYDCKGVPAAAQGATTTPCTVANPGGTKTLAVVGDSHASMWVPALKRAYEGTDWKIVVYLHNSCPFSLQPRALEERGTSTCTAPNRTVLSDLIASKPDRVLMTNLAVDDFTRHANERVAGVWGYEQVMRPLRRAGIDVVALQDAPQPPGGDSVADCVSAHSDDPNACSFKRSDSLEDTGANQAMAAAAKNVGGILTVKPTGLFCTLDECPAVIGSVLVYRDANHVSATYAKTLGGDLRRLLKVR
ncbi:acyltransferase family protein [Brevibacterium sp. BRM-1]|uniref:acyltransferase family protein n=1 Tax=Brevibacterium sp. BRM-1 TaxID=2999062 RepID=UPI00227E8EF0|nr:acyltransferase family protein [Brevibacterium sp. BRM-1]WAL40114.1 acyltransferase family protein [Brevibacterium sp. BRM-1]